MSLSRRLSKETITYAARALQLEGACLCRHRTSSTARRRGRGEVRWSGCPLLVRKRAGVCACLRGHAHLHVLPRAHSKGSQPRHGWHSEQGGPLLWVARGAAQTPGFCPLGARCAARSAVTAEAVSRHCPPPQVRSPQRGAASAGRLWRAQRNPRLWLPPKGRAGG